MSETLRDTIPSYQELMLPVLQLASEGCNRMSDLIAPIAEKYGLSDEALEEVVGDGRTRLIYNRLQWAKTYLSKAGLLASPARGSFKITEEGQRILATSPTSLTNADLKRYAQFREFTAIGKGSLTTDEETGSLNLPAEDERTPEEQIEAAWRQIQSTLQTSVLERIQQNTPLFFERLIIELVVAMGYGGSHSGAARQLGRSGDGGIDGVIDEDRLGLDRIYLQAKRYAQENTVGRPEVQGFVGSLVGLGATKGIFVTTSSFSKQARDFVAGLNQRVVLIDGQTLTKLMLEHGVGVRTSRIIEFQRLDEDFFSEEG
ncbi:restriction endonuclease [Rhodobacteraceae bacterium RKSG542]|uniref:restriction endonuclease n=1 Tax=Pseudovibrio flavus TaxID=2529854 RepID=UPI0012BD0D0C|nr:restriction endonuclease [Pseudovibrio flavus]MTI17437.1 restriction endonuclease [Pseudovibrio flavus]